MSEQSIREGYDKCYIDVEAGRVEPGTVRVKLIGGRNSGAEGWLTGSSKMDRLGNIRLGCDLDGIGVRWVSYFERLSA